MLRQRLAPALAAACAGAVLLAPGTARAATPTEAFPGGCGLLGVGASGDPAAPAPAGGTAPSADGPAAAGPGAAVPSLDPVAVGTVVPGPPGRRRPAGLLIFAAAICVVGASAAAIRAIIAQRAIR